MRSSRAAATGTLKARQSATLAMSVPGTLASVAVRRGQEVHAGALLASLDDGAAAAALKQGEAAVAAARAQLALADDALERVTRIRREDGASEAQLFRVRAQRDLAAAQLAGPRRSSSSRGSTSAITTCALRSRAPSPPCRTAPGSRSRRGCRS